MTAPLPRISASDTRQEALHILNAVDDMLPEDQSMALAAVVTALIYVGDQIAAHTGATDNG